MHKKRKVDTEIEYAETEYTEIIDTATEKRGYRDKDTYVEIKKIQRPMIQRQMKQRPQRQIYCRRCRDKKQRQKIQRQKIYLMEHEKKMTSTLELYKIYTRKAGVSYGSTIRKAQSA